MDRPIRHIAIVGGGTAGWLTAALLAAEHHTDGPDGLSITLIESAHTPPVGVGEGTWPSMRDTLRRIGIRERDLFVRADAAFKQGSRFEGWATGRPGDHYHHPFMLPHGHGDIDLIPAWLQQTDPIAFAELVCAQPHLCSQGLAPKQAHTPEFASVANYGYHFDAGKFGELLRDHAVSRLGVRHLIDDVRSIVSSEAGDIKALITERHQRVEADLFVDCTGMASLLIGAHFGVPLRSCRHVLFNDAALATQVPYPTPDHPVATQTIGTAQPMGWTWDIGLSTRRGVGLVFSTEHTSVEAAHDALLAHIRRTSAAGLALKEPRLLRFHPGYRERFWVRNCVAIGLSAGFVEPLEASALALVEMSAGMLCDELPAWRSDMELVSRRFNERFSHHWLRIIDFLKLHYVLSRREDTDYWRAHRRDRSIPDSLHDALQLWKHRAPSRHDLARVDEVFPSASWQYVLYGMGCRPDLNVRTQRPPPAEAAQSCLSDLAAHSARLARGLPTHRELLTHYRGFHTTAHTTAHATAHATP